MAMPQVQYNERGIPIFTVGGPQPVMPEPGEAGAAEIPTPSGKMVEFVGPAMEGETFKPTGLPPVETPSGKMVEFMPEIPLPSANKPSLSLGWKDAAMIPVGAAETGLSFATGALAQVPANIAASAMLPFTGAESAKSMQEKIMSALTYQPVSDIGQAGNQALGTLMSPITKGLDLTEKAGGFPLRLAIENAMFGLGFKGGAKAVGPKQIPSKIPSMEKMAIARELSDKYGLPTLPDTISPSVLAGPLTQTAKAFKGQIVPMFEKTHDFVWNQMEDIRTGFKDVAEQVDFLGTKGELYDASLMSLPEKFQLPSMKGWFDKKLTKLNDIEKTRALSKTETSLKGWIENIVGEGNEFTSKTISEINGKNPLDNSAKRSVKERMYQDLKKVEGGEAAAEAIKATNQEYRLTTLSRVVTSFINRVTVNVGEKTIIDPAAWKKNYQNFKINNVTKMPELIKKLDEMDKAINAFDVELGLYKEYSVKPDSGMLDKIMKGIAGASVLGVGGNLLNIPYSGAAVATGAGLLGAQRGATMAVKSAIKPGGMLRKGLAKPTFDLNRPSLKIGD
jgi:hypothetical protein